MPELVEYFLVDMKQAWKYRAEILNTRTPQGTFVEVLVRIHNVNNLLNMYEVLQSKVI